MQHVDKLLGAVQLRARKNCADVVAGDVGININKQVLVARGSRKTAQVYVYIAAGHERGTRYKRLTLEGIDGKGQAYVGFCLY